MLTLQIILIFKQNNIIIRSEIHPLYKHNKKITKLSGNTLYIYSTYLINHQKIAIIGKTSYTCLRQPQPLTSAFRTQIHTHVTDVLWKFFVYSRFCKLIDAYMSDSLLYVLNQPYFWLKLLFWVTFSYMQI